MILMIFAALAAFFIKGLAGFANTLVFGSILSFQMSNLVISPIELLLGYPSNIILAWNKRKESDYRIWLPLVALLIVGMIPGAFFLKFGQIETLKVLFGVVVVAIGVEMLIREAHPSSHPLSRKTLGLIGILAGFLCGIFGIGALLAAYISRATHNSDAFKGNLCFVFVFENTFRIILYISSGIITLSNLLLSLKLIPFMLGGLFLGMKCSNHLSEKIIKTIVILALIISGITLILFNIKGMYPIF